jgi:hypothetical protein
MSYHAKIIFGKDEVRKYHNNVAFTDDEKSINLKNYTFETRAERDAFYEGIDEAMGWLEYEVIDEFEDKNKREKEDEAKFDYWDFIEKHYPKYYSCNQILLSDILTKKLDGEEICEEDEEYIKDWDIKAELLKLDQAIMQKAMKNYFEIKYA